MAIHAWDTQENGHECRIRSLLSPVYPRCPFTPPSSFPYTVPHAPCRAGSQHLKSRLTRCRFDPKQLPMFILPVHLLSKARRPDATCHGQRPLPLTIAVEIPCGSTGGHARSARLRDSQCPIQSCAAGREEHVISAPQAKEPAISRHRAVPASSEG